MSFFRNIHNWIFTTEFQSILVRNNANRQVTKTNFVTEITPELVAAGFQQSVNLNSELAIKTVSANYQVLTTDSLIFADCSSGSIIITMPLAASMYNASTLRSVVQRIKRLDAHATNTCTILPTGAETIDGQASIVLSGINYPHDTIISNGTNLFTV